MAGRTIKGGQSVDLREDDDYSWPPLESERARLHEELVTEIKRNCLRSYSLRG